MTEVKNNDNKLIGSKEYWQRPIELDKNSTNFIKARGRIIGLYVDRSNRNIFTLYIRNNSSQGRNVYLSFSYEGKLPSDIKVNDTVEMEGFVYSYVFGNNRRYTQYLVCNKIRKIEPEIKNVFGVKDGFNYNDLYIRAYFAGELTNIDKTSNRWTVLEVKIPAKQGVDEHPTNTVRCQFSNNMRVNDVDVNVGDNICLVAFMSSKRKLTEDEEVIQFENFIIDDMAVVKNDKEDTSVKEEIEDKAVEVTENDQNVINDYDKEDEENSSGNEAELEEDFLKL